MKELYEKFEKESPIKTILKFSLPSSFGAVIGLICVLTDRYFIGQVAGREGMAAVSIAFPYAMIISAFTFLFTGIAIIVGVKLGSNDRTGAERYLCSGMIWIILIGTLLTIILFIFNISILEFLGAKPNNIKDAISYTKYLIPLGTFQMILGQSTLIRGVGDTITAMSVNIFTALVNILLDYYFVMKYGMGIGGASLATLIATALSAVYVIYYFYKSKIVSLKIEKMKFNFEILKEIFRIGSPKFYNQVLQSTVVAITNKQVGVYGGEIATAAIGIVFICRTIINTSMQGFNQGTAAILSYNFGAKNYKRIKEILKIQVKMVGMSSIVLLAIIFINSEEIVSFFIKNDEALVKYTSKAIKINLCMMPATVIFLSWNNFFQSIKQVRISSTFFVIRILVLNIPLVYIFGALFKNDGVWAAFPVSDTIVTIALGILTYKKLKKMV